MNADCRTKNPPTGPPEVGGLYRNEGESRAEHNLPSHERGWASGARFADTVLGFGFFGTFFQKSTAEEMYIVL